MKKYKELTQEIKDRLHPSCKVLEEDDQFTVVTYDGKSGFTFLPDQEDKHSKFITVRAYKHENEVED